MHNFFLDTLYCYGIRDVRKYNQIVVDDKAVILTAEM